MKLSRLIRSIATIAAGTAITSGAYAMPVLTLDDMAGLTTQIVDNQAGDLDATVGRIAYAGAQSSAWDSFFIVASTQPDAGTALLPDLNILFIGDASAAGSQMQLALSDNAYMGISAGPSNSSVTGIQANVGAAVYGGNSANLFDTSNLLLSANCNGAIACNNSSSTGFMPSVDPYSLTLAMDITSTSNVTTIATSHFAVPTPGGLALFGLGTLALGMVRRKRNPGKS